MDLNNLLRLAGLAAQLPEANTAVSDNVPGKANTKPDPKMFPDGPSNLGSVSDTSLRRYLKAKGQPVSVDETTYPDYSVEEVLESYVAYTAEKAKNPYAIGMASAMKSTGDKPPLKKSTINKAHKIAKGIGESSLNEAEGTYARVIYDYSEDFGMITLYDNGNKIDEWSGYFGADTVGNPLADKFVEIAKKNGLNPEGMNIVDDEGEKGTFENNTFNWDQFANDATGMNEEPNEGNEFSGALAQAKKSGKSEFEVDGKRFKVKEASKPDFLDMDKDGNKKEPMKKALKDKEKVSESIELTNLKVLAGL